MTRSGGFSRLELMTVIIVVSLVAAILLDRLRTYQEAAEKADVEYAIRMIKGELRIRMATMLTRGHAHEYASLVGKNPVEWMEHKPHNYLGSFKGADIARAAPGNWYFDADRRVLIYLVRTGAHFQAASGEPKQVRLKIVVVPNGADTAPGSPVSVTIDVESYRWF